MSYDLLLVRFRSQVNPPRSFDQIQAADLNTPAGNPIDLDHLAGLLMTVLPVLERYEEEDEVVLAAPTWGQISLSQGAASIKLPYWHDSHAAPGVVAQLWQVLAILQIEGRLHACDPQLGKVLDLQRDQESVLQEYLQGRAVLLSAIAPGEPVGVTAALAGSRRPWWKFWE